VYSLRTKVAYATDVTIGKTVRLKSYRVQRKKVKTFFVFIHTVCPGKWWQVFQLVPPDGENIFDICQMLFSPSGGTRHCQCHCKLG
jgi:hypothetical protein